MSELTRDESTAMFPSAQWDGVISILERVGAEPRGSQLGEAGSTME
ncbi:MAG: hypothetical protein WB822_17950 [Rhodoplanes sp.]